MASDDGGSLKSKREKCGLAKDALWSCLDGLKDESDSTACEELRRAFEGNCTKTHVKYWDQRRIYLKQKAALPSYVETEGKKS